MGTIQSTLERWRTSIRLGETAVVIGLWAGALAMSDVVIAQVLFAFGLAIGVVAITADPNRSRPSAALLIVLLLLCFLGAEGLFLWRHQTTSQAIPPPTVIRETTRLVSIPAPTPSATEPKPEPIYPKQRIVIEEVRVPTARPAPVPAITKMPELQNILDKTIKKTDRDSVEFWASFKCQKTNMRLEAGLISLANEAAISENQYHDYRNSKQIVGDLNRWLPRAEAFIKDHKDDLPDTAAFSLANGSARRGLFEGSGVAAWSIMDEKRQALQSIQNNVHARQCDLVGKAAVADCEETDSCHASQSALMNSSR